MPRRAERPPPRRAATRWAAVGLLGAVLGVVAALAVAGVAEARADLLAGRASLEAAAGAAADGDFAAAGSAFEEAAGRFQNAQERLGTVPVRVAGQMPVAAQNVAAARGLARAGELGAAAGGQVTGAVAGLPDGLASLAPRDGVVPLAPLSEVAGPLADAADRLSAARDAVESTPRRRLLDFVAAARQEAALRVGEAADGLAAGAALAEQLPAFLGAEGRGATSWARRTPRSCAAPAG